MEEYIRRLLRELTTDRGVIQGVRWAYRRSGVPMPTPLLYEYVMFMLHSSYSIITPGMHRSVSKYPHFREELVEYIESVLNSKPNVIPERFEGSDASDGIYYSGWEGKFSTNQPMTHHLTDNIGNLSINIDSGYEPQFQWALICQDSVGPDGPIYSRDFEGGDAFGNLRQLCLELQDNLRQNRGCDQWKVRWSHGQDVTTNITEITEEEKLGHLPKNEVEQEMFDNYKQHVDHYSTTHGFFIWITHPINQHILDQIEVD
jgi:hypothetical protein